ncbi:MAG: hypothetical protein M1594_01550 [Candidatus Marsarchaeota archaeon]|nr:hypothetical protein [Candidatus Marsarchaeota archaeon]
MQRGQAFETIMMVIAVIVALAILGFLTGILGNLGSMFNPSDPVKTMTSALQGIAGQYSSGTSPQVLAFSQSGQNINTIQLTSNTQLSSDEVYFACTSNLKKTGDLVVTSSQSTSSTTASQLLTIKNKVTVEMVACGDPSHNGAPYYVIAFGVQGDTTGTSTACYKSFTSGDTSGYQCSTS